MLYITRHGETQWNREKRIMGRCDEPLNETGIAQAYELKEKLKDYDYDLIICSPLIRTGQTAEIINEDRNIEIVYDERIIERDFGEFDGAHKDEFPYFAFWDYYLNEHYQKAENIRDFFNRVYDFLDDIKEDCQNRNILLVTHGGVSMPVDCYFKKAIPEGHLSGTGLALRNCEIRTYRF